MKWRNVGIKTLRQDPADSGLISYALLARGGYLKKLSAGIFTYGPLLLRSIKKFEQIVRKELDKIDCIEILMPMVQPKEIWVQSGRWKLYDDLLQKMTSRTGRDFCLGPTHEEVIAEYVKNDINSYRDLPLYLYQIQTKFRDEIRPRFGLMRAKEFIMKDAYSFDSDVQQAEKSYQKMRTAYQAIFSQLGVKFRIVQADSGEIGGSQSEEFHILAQQGESELLVTDTTAVSQALNLKLRVGDTSPDGQVFQRAKGIETGHIFYLGDKYSKAMSVVYKDKKGEQQNVQMGCYGVGITRTIQAVLEQSHDANGLIWPVSVAPFLVHICLLDPEHKETAAAAEKLYQSLWDKGIDVFLDDRLEKPGVKFKDADLLGMPLRVDIGARDIASSGVELVNRKNHHKQKILLSEVSNCILAFASEAGVRKSE